MEKCCRTCRYFILGYCQNISLPITICVSESYTDTRWQDKKYVAELDNVNGNFYITNPTDFCCSKYE